MALQIDLLYTEDCTDWETADSLLHQVLDDLGIVAQFQYWLIQNDRQAIEYGFSGSPEIRVNGDTLFPVNTPAGLKLRSYMTEEGILGHPTYSMLADVLQSYT